MDADLIKRGDALSELRGYLALEDSLVCWDVEQILYGIPRADLTTSPEVVKELVEALRAVVAALHDAEKTLTEELHHMDFCGESLPLCKARAALAKLEGGE